MNSGADIALPTVEALNAIPAEQLPALALRLAALQSAVAARLAAERALDRHRDTEERLLTVEEAAAKLGTTKDWLRR